MEIDIPEVIDKILFCGVVKDDDYLTVLIKNSCRVQSININSLYQSGYSTKENGHGIGLYNAKKILSQYPDVLHNTNCCDDDYFLQQLKLPVIFPSKGNTILIFS